MNKVKQALWKSMTMEKMTLKKKIKEIIIRKIWQKSMLEHLRKIKDATYRRKRYVRTMALNFYFKEALILLS